MLETLEDLDRCNNLIILNNQSRIFSAMGLDLLNYAKGNYSLFFYHHYGITAESFLKNHKIRAFGEPTSWSLTPNGTIFISTIEAFNYPFFGTQYHPEKASFDGGMFNSSHTNSSIALMQYYASFFVNLARSNYHKFNALEEEHALIYNYKTD